MCRQKVWGVEKGEPRLEPFSLKHILLTAKENKDLIASIELLLIISTWFTLISPSNYGMELSYSNVKQAGTTHGEEMSPWHMNHPERSDVPCALDQTQPSASLARARSSLMAERAHGTRDRMRGSWLPYRSTE